jgi:hypothetical protein
MAHGQTEALRMARAFYSERGVQVKCVVTEREEPQWHHLDEANPRRWRYTNLIPLDGSLNQLLDKRKHRYLPLELQPTFLEARGFEHYRRGKFVQGYACDRLGSYLMYPPRGDVPIGIRPDPSKALEFASYALLNLRPISALECAIDTLQLNVVPILRSPVPLSRRSVAHVVVEIDSYYRDYGAPREGIECCDLATRLLAADPALVAAATRVIQHKGIALAAMGEATVSSWFLERSKEALGTGVLYEEGYGNYALWKARLNLNSTRPDLDYCRELIRSIYDLQQKGRTAIWTFAEAVWTHAEIESMNGRQSRSNDQVLHGRDLFVRSGVVPTAILTPKSARRFKEKYPRELYVLPRSPRALREFRGIAQQAVALIEERLREGTLTN